MGYLSDLFKWGAAVCFAMSLVAAARSFTVFEGMGWRSIWHVERLCNLEHVDRATQKEIRAAQLRVRRQLWAFVFAAVGGCLLALGW